MALTVRQQRFIDAYDGNATDAARKAGYSGSDAVLGVTAHDLLRNPKVAAAIRERLAPVTKAIIATREERQAFWTSVQQDPFASMSDRLRASELLGKSEADFTDKVKHEGNISIGVVSPYAAPGGE